MTKAKILESIKKQFGKRIKKVFDKSERRIYMDIDKKDIKDITKFIFKDLGSRFNTASAVDAPKHIEIVYHFSFDELALVVSIRTFVDKKDCEIDSLTPIMKGAGWIEREIHELFGVHFNGNPDLRHLLLPDDWPKDKFPLRRNCKI